MSGSEGGKGGAWLARNRGWLYPLTLIVLLGLPVGWWIYGNGSPGPQPLCGNGVVNPGEQCDGADLTQCLAGQSCSSCKCVFVVEQPTPTPPAGVCGNGVHEPQLGEQCDGSSDACAEGQACSSDCRCVDRAPLCGNGVVNPGEQCDGTDLTQCLAGQSCSSCQCVFVVEQPTPTPPAGVCGNGVVEGDEQCDKSSDTCAEGQACTSDCQCVSRTTQCFCEVDAATNGWNGNWTCTTLDGVLVSTVYDPVSCPLPSICGNGVVESGEQCESNADCGSGATCTKSCTCKTQCTCVKDPAGASGSGHCREDPTKRCNP